MLEFLIFLLFLGSGEPSIYSKFFGVAISIKSELAKSKLQLDFKMLMFT